MKLYNPPPSPVNYRCFFKLKAVVYTEYATCCSTELAVKVFSLGKCVKQGLSSKPGFLFTCVHLTITSKHNVYHNSVSYLLDKAIHSPEPCPSNICHSCPSHSQTRCSSPVMASLYALNKYLFATIFPTLICLLIISPLSITV